MATTEFGQAVRRWRDRAAPDTAGLPAGGHRRAAGDSGVVGQHEAARKTIDHPQVGPVTLDCDILTVAGSDLRIMIYTAEPGSEDAERLALITVLGIQTLVG